MSRESAPAAWDLVTELAAAPTTPVKVLVSGGIGMGKSAMLAAVRATLRAAGVDVHSRATSGGAVVVDDAHLLDDDELTRLSSQVAESDTTVVVATEPRLSRTALRDLVTELERENPPVRLAALTPAQIGRELTELLSGPPTADMVRTVLGATAGLPFLVRAVREHVTEGDTAQAVHDIARYALIDRLRRVDEPVLNTMLIASISLDLGPDDVAAALGLSTAQARLHVDAARASGLLEPSYRPPFLASVHAAVAQILGTARHHDIERSLLRSQLELSTLTADLAVRLGEHGLRDDALGAALTDLARRSGDHPAEAARLFRAAAQAGGAGPRAPLADALALTGDVVSAGRLADDLLSSEAGDERGAAVRIAATIAMHDGNSAQAAELVRWLGPHPDPHVGAAALIAALSAGDADTARAALRADNGGPPTSAARAARSLGDGLLLTLDQPYGAAVAKLSQAVTSDSPSLAMPDTPAALVTLAAIHGGDPVRARSVISRALTQRNSAVDPLFGRRHRMLLAWIKMLDGQLAGATADADAAGGARCRRDALWAEALRTGIARRAGDGGAMQKHWYAAMEVLAESSVDLFSLLPLGEVWVAAARLRQVEQLQHTLDATFALLTACGNPVLWAVPLHWAGVHAGILANAPSLVAPHGQALAAAASAPQERSAFAATLATAGRTWLRVLANQVNAEGVTASARALSQAGLTWDATRLASQAALHATDGRVSGVMLAVARDLKVATAGEDIVPGTDATSAGEAAAPVRATRPSRAAQLSEREREVAELLLLGLPYRDIGAQLFISAKTVEHHVARIRRRLGAESRSEMLSMLRTMLAPQS